MSVELEVPADVEEPLKVRHQTKDINVAAFLWTCPGVDLVDVVGKSKTSTTMYFVLELPMDTCDLGKLLFEYANGKTRVDPLAFCGRQNQLRDLLHSTLPKKRLENE